MAVLNQLQQYGVGFQIKVLSSLLKDKEFLQNINDVLININNIQEIQTICFVYFHSYKRTKFR